MYISKKTKYIRKIFAIIFSGNPYYITFPHINYIQESFVQTEGSFRIEFRELSHYLIRKCRELDFVSP